jgi:hypothetical protein
LGLTPGVDHVPAWGAHEEPADAPRFVGRLTLDESLALTGLVVQKDPGLRSGYTVRWRLRLVEEGQNRTIEEAVLLKLGRPESPRPGRIGSKAADRGSDDRRQQVDPDCVEL